MVIAGLVAGVLCASVGWMVVTQGLLAARSEVRERRETDHALVTDCLANIDRVIDLRDATPRNGAAPGAPDVVTPGPPSTWRAPTSSAPRSATATA